MAARWLRKFTGVAYSVDSMTKNGDDWLIFLFCMCFLALFASFSGSAQAVETQQNAPEWIKPPDFMYSPTDKQDPFHPIIQATPSEPSPEDQPKKKLTPLERIQPSQLKLVGILRQPNGQRQAMVELPNGKGYILQVGVSIGQRQGRVTAITASTVVIQETTTNVFGKQITEDTIVKLRQQGGQPNG